MLTIARLSEQDLSNQQTVSCGCGKNARVDSHAFKRDLADITRLMSTCSHYGKWPIRAIERVIVPPIILHQYKIFRYAKQPVGFVTWAFFSDEVHEIFINRTRLLQPYDFTSGDRLWIMDLCISTDAPKGLAAKAGRYLRRKFVDRKYQGGAFWKRGNKEVRVVRSAYV
tara:strand:- start:280 stop:786 length:507 start_codon:yes stop_codon:yes gene_type:complete